MTIIINIENGTSLYTAEDLIRYNDAGLLYCHDVCLSSVIDKLVEYYEEKLCEMEENEGEAYSHYQEGYQAAVSEIRGFVDNM